MHEMGIVRNIVAIVSEHAAPQRVKRVRLEIGKLSAVMPAAIRFCFDLASAGTVLDGAELEIIEIPGRARCRSCGKELALAGLMLRCPCGSRELVKSAGEELNIKEYELEAA